MTGFTGLQGLQGPSGPQGIQGPSGLTGPQGIQGPSGLTGPQGTTGFTGPQGTTGFTGPQGTTGPKGDSSGPLISFFPPVQAKVSGTGLDWNGVETLEGKNKTGDTYYVGVNVPDPNHYTVIPAKNSFIQAVAEYTYSGIGPLTLSNFTVKAILIGVPNILNVVGHTYNVLINDIIKSTVVLNASIIPQIGQDTAIFTIIPGDKIVIKATLNPGDKKPDDPDDMSFEWSVNIS
jgi:hypothetical protein